MNDDVMVPPGELVRRAHVAAEAASSLRHAAAPLPPPAGRSSDELAEAIRQVAERTDLLAAGLTTMASAFVAAARRYDVADAAVADSLSGWSGP